MQTFPLTAEQATVRLLCLDRSRKQVLLCKEFGDQHWFLPCGALPGETTPEVFAEALISRSVSSQARGVLLQQIRRAAPAAWIYPPASLNIVPDVLQIVYLLSLQPEDLGNCVTSRFWLVEQLPEDIFGLEPILIQSIRFAESRDALPIDMRQRRPARVYEIEGVSFAHEEAVLIVGGGEEAESVQEYVGRTGRVVNITNTRPRWFCVLLDCGSQIVARPHHLQRAGQPQAVAQTRTLAEANMIGSAADARKAARIIRAACFENWNGRAFNVYCKRELEETDGIRITRARVRQGQLQVYGLGAGRWITNPVIVYQMI